MQYANSQILSVATVLGIYFHISMATLESPLAASSPSSTVWKKRTVIVWTLLLIWNMWLQHWKMVHRLLAARTVICLFLNPQPRECPAVVPSRPKQVWWLRDHSSLSDPKPSSPSCTTHLSNVDGDADDDRESKAL